MKKCDYFTINYPARTEGVRSRRLEQRYIYSPSVCETKSIEYKIEGSKQLGRIARSFNMKLYASIDRSKVDSTKRRFTTHKRKSLDSVEEVVSRVARASSLIPTTQQVGLNALKGEGFYLNNRFNRRSYTRTIVPTQSNKSKRVVPLEFQQQLKEASRTMAKQNLYEWMKHKKEDVLSKVSKQIKLKSEFQKFIPT